MKDERPLLAFVSPVFLFPNDAGGKIRTTNILRGLKGGKFRLRLLAPATSAQTLDWQSQIDSICDEFVPWKPTRPKPRWLRALDLIGPVPVNIAADKTAPALAAVQALADGGGADLVVFDFVHAHVLRPARLRGKKVCFTHNVEAEIFARHAQQAPDAARRWMWTSQHRKMVRYESEALRQYDRVVAVSERDAQHFRDAYGVQQAHPIPTGVDLDQFEWKLPPDEGPPTVVFSGSMDSPANIGGVQYFISQVWPQVTAQMPSARFIVVGRKPPSALVAAGRRAANVEFTGYVDDVRPYVRRSQVSVIPLLVGGGTRIKAYEAMAMGSPVVSTAVGIEGLALTQGQHYLGGDEAGAFADAVLLMLGDRAAREELSRRARALVESQFGHRVAAQVFEAICWQALKEAS